MIAAVSAFVESNLLLISVSIFALTIAFISRSIFTKQKETTHEEFMDVEYLMDDHSVFTPPNDARR